MILRAVPLNSKLILRMTAVESMHSFSKLKHERIFDYVEDAVRIRAIYTRIVYFLKGI